jgi:hypothetical protein
MPLFDDSKLFPGRRLKGRDRRACSVSTKLTFDEFELIDRASRASGKALGEWARDVLIRASKTTAEELTHQDLLSEIVGVELLVMNSLGPLIRGQTMTSEWFNSTVKQVSKTKVETAKSIAEMYLAARRKASEGNHERATSEGH